VHGSADRNLPFDGGAGARAIAVHGVKSVASAIEFWRRNDGCSAPSSHEQNGAITRTRYGACAAAARSS
jgi:hypothetical protein